MPLVEFPTINQSVPPLGGKVFKKKTARARATSILKEDKYLRDTKFSRKFG